MEEDLEHNISALQTAVKEQGLAVNWTKTNTIAIGGETTGCKVEVEGHNVENVREAVYLGVKFGEDRRMEGELERRVGIAMSNIGAMKAKVFGNRGLSWKAKMQEFRQRLQQRSIVDVVRVKRESWRVKVMEKQGSLVERVMAGEVEGRRTRGRPRKRWGDPF